MLLLGRLRSRTCQGLTPPRGPADRRQLRARPVAGRPAALPGRGGRDRRPARRSPFSSCGSGAARRTSTPGTPSPTPPSTTAGRSAPSRRRRPASASASCFPKIAKLSDHFAIVRSLHTGSNDHGVAGTIGLTGSAGGGVGLDGKPLPGARPADDRQRRGAGPRRRRQAAAVHRGRRPAAPGQEGHRRRGRRRRSAACTIPFRLEYDPVHGTRIPALQLPDDLTPERLDDRQRLLEAFDQAWSGGPTRHGRPRPSTTTAPRRSPC